tara:strand:- start:9151 stop:9462 length:312 start_codon:yes stop_codon:yes gene_type:complete
MDYNSIFDELKKKHNVIYWLDIPASDESEAKVIFLRKMDRLTYSAGQKILEKDTLQAAEMMIKSLFIGGDDLAPIFADFDQFRVTADLMAEVMATKSGNVRKL